MRKLIGALVMCAILSVGPSAAEIAGRSGGELLEDRAETEAGHGGGELF